jgi:hypothetical protein
MKILVYGSKGWIGQQFMGMFNCDNCKNRDIKEGTSRLDNIEAVKKKRTY